MSDKLLEKSYIPFQCMIINSIAQFHLEEIGTAQYYILESLSLKGKQNAKKLAEERGITQSGISKLNKKLLDKGYIMQERSLSDRRYYDISITNEGRTFLKRAEQSRGNILEIIEKALNKNEIQQFSLLCEKILQVSVEYA